MTADDMNKTPPPPEARKSWFRSAWFAAVVMAGTVTVSVATCVSQSRKATGADEAPDTRVVVKPLQGDCAGVTAEASVDGVVTARRAAENCTVVLYPAENQFQANGCGAFSAKFAGATKTRKYIYIQLQQKSGSTCLIPVTAPPQ